MRRFDEVLRRAGALLVVLASSALAQDALPFSDGRWKFRGDSTAVDTLEGRETLRMQSGSAERRDVSVEDGTIDVDVKTTRRRSFVFVRFRMQEDGEGEEFYVRPHKSALPDAVQYNPVYQEVGQWQLYYGPGATAAPEIPAGVWTHLRIVLSGSRAAVFLGDTARPVLLIPRLAREPKGGWIALSGFLPAGTPGSGAIAEFANVRVRPGVIPYAFAAVPPEPQMAAGVVASWSVGEPFDAKNLAPMSIESRWTSTRTRVAARPSGLVELHRQVKMPEVTQDVGIAASFAVTAVSAGIKRFDLGFSDAATVFLNGRPLYHGDASYSYLNRRDGVIGYDQATVYLPLRAGRNEITVVVTDHFGGWGIMGRFADMSGIAFASR